jgi:hypothetical protein
LLITMQSIHCTVQVAVDTCLGFVVATAAVARPRLSHLHLPAEF